MRTFLVLLVFATPAASFSGSTENAATTWLQSHQAPSADQLGDLKSANPAAYALVNALLNKHRKSQLPDDERGPDVFRRMLSPKERSAVQSNVAVPYASADLAEVQPAVVDQKSYDPHTAADRDETSVSRLLDAVASMGGEKGKKIALLNHHRHAKQTVDNPLVEDGSLFGTSVDSSDAQVFSHPLKAKNIVDAPQAQVQSASTTTDENPYLKGIGLDEDLPGAKRAHKHLDDTTDSLATFTFGDASPKAEPASEPEPSTTAAPMEKKENSFLKWLGVTKKAPAPVEHPLSATKASSKSDYAGYFS